MCIISFVRVTQIFTQMFALLAHLVEHLTLNQGVQGSSPWRRTQRYRFYGRMSHRVGAFFIISYDMRVKSYHVIIWIGWQLRHIKVKLILKF